VFLSLFILIFVASTSVGYALTIISSGFGFTAGDTYNDSFKKRFDPDNIYEHDFATVTGNNEVGIFSFSYEDIQKIIHGNYYAVSIGLSFTMFDGDTGIYEDESDDTDYGDLVLSLGNSANTLTFNQFYLNGFYQETKNTVGYDFKIGSDYLATSLTGLVQDSNGALIFYITDTDEGGNKLFFDKDWAKDFNLSITFDSPLVLVPEPGTLFLISSGILWLMLIRLKKMAPHKNLWVNFGIGSFPKP
jgi:hypothetical protein